MSLPSDLDKGGSGVADGRLYFGPSLGWLPTYIERAPTPTPGTVTWSPAAIGGNVTPSGGVLTGGGGGGGGGLIIVSGFVQNLYVNPTIGSDSNDGLTTGTAWKTIQHAAFIVSHTYYIDNGPVGSVSQILVNLADGIYNESFIELPPVAGGGSVVLLGNGTTPINVDVRAMFNVSGDWGLYGMQISRGLDVNQSGDVTCIGKDVGLEKVVFTGGGSTTAHVFVSGSCIPGNVTFTADHATPATGITVDGPGATVRWPHGSATFIGMPHYSTCFIGLTHGSQALIYPGGFAPALSGNFTGPLYNTGGDNNVLGIFPAFLALGGPGVVGPPYDAVYTLFTGLNLLHPTSSEWAATLGSGGTAGNVWHGDGTWSAAGGGSGSIAIGATPITGGTSGNQLYDSAGVVGERTAAQSTAFLSLFTPALQGVVPASSGGITTFLRADGTWAPAQIFVTSSHQNYYVNPSTGNDVNNGLTTGTAWKTIQHAVNYVVQNVVITPSMAGTSAQVLINLADGLYNENFIALGAFNGGGSVVLLGNGTTPTNVDIRGAFEVAAGAWALFGMQIGRCTFGSSIAGDVDIAPGASCSLEKVAFTGGGSTLALVNVDGSCITGNITITNQFATPANAYTISGAVASLTMGSGTITFTGPPSFSSSFIYVQNNGRALLTNAASGSFTGALYIVGACCPLVINNAFQALGTVASTWTPSAIVFNSDTGAILRPTSQESANYWSGAPSGTLGTVGVGTGALNLKGITSGTVTQTVAAAAGTWTMTLPATAGVANQFLQTNGSGVCTWAAPGIPINNQVTAYTLVLADANTAITHPATDNNARTFIIPANASVAYPTGTTLTFVNMANTLTISINTDTMTLAGSGSTGFRTLAANGIATALKLTSTTWLISGTGLT